MFGRRRSRDSSAKRTAGDAEVTASQNEGPATESDSTLPVVKEELILLNENENAKKEKAPKKPPADKSKNAKKTQSKASQLSQAKPARAPAPNAAPAAPPPQPRLQQQQYQPPPQPISPVVENSVISLDARSSVAVGAAASNASAANYNETNGAHDPVLIHKILTKIHFPAMHPMFLAENVAPAVLPTQLLTDHEMVTIFIDCLSRSPNKFGLFPCNKRWYMWAYYDLKRRFGSTIGRTDPHTWAHVNWKG